MTLLEYLSTIFIIQWNPLVLWLLIHGGDPPPPDVASRNTLINIYYGVLTAVTVIAMAPYQEELRTLPYGALAALPAMQIAVGLYYNNVAVPAQKKAKA